MEVLGMRKKFEFEGGMAVGTESVTIAMSKIQPSPKAIGHKLFHLQNMTTLQTALENLKKHMLKGRTLAMKSASCLQGYCNGDRVPRS